MSARSTPWAGAALLAPLYTRAQSRAVDAALIAAGVPGVVLMENAGRGAAEALLALTHARGLRRVAVLAGPGNNGGDAYVVARHAHTHGLEVALWSLGDPARVAGDAAVMRDAWRAVGGAIHAVADDIGSDAAPWPGDEYDALVDGLFGTGLNRALEGVARALVERTNRRARVLTVALDVPSGLDADTGAPLGDERGVVRATHTLTFGTGKPGLHTGAGRVLAGEVRVLGLGAPLPATLEPARVVLAHPTPLAARRADAHKGDNGHVLIVGGSAGKTGAALLAARGAHRAGAGLVTIASRAAAAVDLKVVETMTLALADDGPAAAATLAADLARFDAVVVGPGLGRDSWAASVFDAVLTGARSVVVDADALTLLRDRGRRAGDAAPVLTPHPLEMARLLGTEGGAAAVNADRVRVARECAARFDAVVVLKGAGTVVAVPDGDAAIVPCAEPTLGVAGSGDVLAGAIAARVAERAGRRSPAGATLEAVLAHGRAGARVRAARGSSRGALATEIADALGAALESEADLPTSDASLSRGTHLERTW